LIEVMVAAGILTAGIVAVLQAIVFAGNVAASSNETAKALLLAQDKLQELEIRQVRRGFMPGEVSGQASFLNWKCAVRPTEKLPGAYAVAFDAAWLRHGKEERIGFETYVRQTK
jgi:hypothetical protein